MVPYGGMKKKLNRAKPTTEATMPGPSPPSAAAAITTAMNANPLLSGVVPSRTCSSRKVSAALPARATANPAACRPKLTAGVGASAGDRPGA